MQKESSCPLQNRDKSDPENYQNSLLTNKAFLSKKGVEYNSGRKRVTIIDLFKYLSLYLCFKQ